MELKTAKGRLFFFLSLIVFLPLLQHTFNFIESGKLKGYFEQKPDVQFTPEKWWNGSYQEKKTLFLNDSFGFRPDFVRMNNQIDFTLFKKLHSGDVYVGVDNYLLGRSTVNEYEGISPISTDIIRDDVIKLKMIQDTLDHLGKTFIFAYAPSKPYLYPDKIPHILIPRDGRKISDYFTFKRLGDSLKLRQLDFNALFMAMKDTIHGSLITKQGSHWSMYGSLFAADALTKFIERERKIKMPELTITAMHYSDSARNTDNDFASTTNLIFPFTKELFCYPDYHFSADATTTKPKVVYIGDSFAWTWIYTGYLQNANSSWEYWYYFTDIWNPESVSGKGPLKKIDSAYWQKQISDADCVVALFTPISFHLLNDQWFFIDQFYDHYYPKKK